MNLLNHWTPLGFAMRQACCFGMLMVCAVGATENTHAQAVRRSAQRMLVYDGFTEPDCDVMVAAVDVGLLREMLVEVGDVVEQGQLIASLDDDLQRSAVQIARLQAEMKGNLDATAAELSLQQSRAVILRELQQKDMARPDELRRAEADLEISQARDLTAREQAALRLLELQRYELQLERRQIRSPKRGVISHLYREPGEYVSPSDAVIARLLVIDKLIGVFNVPAEEIGMIRVGSPGRVYLRSTGSTIATQIQSIAPDIDGESGTVQIRVELDNSSHSLRAGDRCTLSISPDAQPSVSLVPTPAWLSNQETRSR
ncbi:efflux RND transporter periplasmic adaptor subunit [Novipirellula artificiosorum]|uniref:Multidrug resistance protein MdtN n=1 Tax=Novipirellula artificiosorum TaxID=2528016 RepID=A0A5C6DWG4_9BACT|nr:efflux RND transporter periplasmic adaptor subunit [Novipirellula artificiosorum]TWU41008.1 multidrug resistance protein MdtN [Novipirellula artificiosorum]